MQKILNKTIRISTLFNCIMLSLFLYYMIAWWNSYPFSVGGTLIFFSVIGLNIYLSFLYKEFLYELTLISLILFSLITFNFFGYIEYYRGFSNMSVIVMFILILLIMYITWFLSLMPFKANDRYSAQVEVELRKRISYLVGHLIFIVLCVTTMTIAMLKAMADTGSLIKTSIYSFSVLTMIWLSASVCFVLLYMKKWNYLADYISALVVKKTQLDINNIKRLFIAIAIGTLLIGSVFETQRRLWLLWFCSWLSSIVLLKLIWKTWRSVFLTNSFDRTDIQLIKVKMLPSFAEPKYFIKAVGILSLVVIFYILVMLVLAKFLRHNG